ncbi:uncharacterized protein LOC111702648 [Eurytemora carolleeae]|uniref:uncharacterized protein LOC111702648 n=1 Tax=Eurytemora carolleeae TaxID=1294199 RepID=UPI000C779755|nr:uncharacterized protein LOC111702648 [Eurytemora carolleeae]XP_023330170.1 uncharacterized protein LOC111702648 [Eurytemora carolleeae]XP_023330171.1 uncharacterized protein LOC111702648 [Eurytemora carolleeae]|eukprot:XP_023330169.1 uncharacterized protein LOC111702648 [Eurytemora affinis]
MRFSIPCGGQDGSRRPWGGYAAVFGGFLLQFTMGAFYSFGNLSTYMTSYMRQNGSPNITYTDFVIVQSAWGMTQGCVMPFSGFIIKAIGQKASMVIGSFIFSGGCALTYFTIQKELWMVAATYGFVSAFGQNIALIPTLTTGMKWFPNNKGTAMGLVVGGFGGGAFAFNNIQTAILNPNNVDVARDGPDKGYFVDEDLLSRVPDLLLILSGIYLCLGWFACLLITQPPDDWLDRQGGDEREIEQGKKEKEEDEQKVKEAEEKRKEHKLSEEYLTPCEAFRRKELYLLWITRLSVVMVTQVIAAFYKAFGQTFIKDDQFLSIVGAVTSVFNCTGRLFYGFIMDKTAYKVAMCVEASLLILLMSTFYLTSLIGVDTDCTTDTAAFLVVHEANSTLVTNPCDEPTSLLTKIVYALWVWAIFFTFPGTYSTQPAVTTQTFGHKYGGFIYAFLFSSDIINNLLVATVSKAIKEALGWLGLFLIVSSCGFIALGATIFYPYTPRPGPRPTSTYCQYGFLARLGLVELSRLKLEDYEFKKNPEKKQANS